MDVVRELRGTGVNNHRPTVRATIVIAKILASRHAHARTDDPVFQWVCHDVLSAETAKVTHDGESLMPDKVNEATAKVWGAPKLRKSNGQVHAAVNGKN